MSSCSKILGFVNKSVIIFFISFIYESIPLIVIDKSGLPPDFFVNNSPLSNSNTGPSILLCKMVSRVIDEGLVNLLSITLLTPVTAKILDVSS